ncbi:hypothetical protein [Streptomyces sp. B3I8]|uniref:hypothetical protein n=1 Tax=Streptomyces sp. B3I8 TaxID=3042303 RepID=UPI0027803B4C|nr:hypothetical protein [Streptomyces sp. B3I8]MDQ0787087.1 hypothetical protein [Streptomyces sp. B3I8]
MTRGAPHRTAALTLAALITTGLLVLAAPTSATAATPTTNATALCPGHKVRTLSFSTGSVQVFRRGDYLCALTYPKKKSGKKTMSVSVQARGSRAVVDRGRFTHHAGPISVHAGHRCVWIRGSVDSGSVSSGWILC